MSLSFAFDYIGFSDVSRYSYTSAAIVNTNKPQLLINKVYNQATTEPIAHIGGASLVLASPANNHS